MKQRICVRIDLKKIVYVLLFIIYLNSFVTGIVNIPHYYTISTVFLCIPSVYFLYRYSAKRVIPHLFVSLLLFFSLPIFITLYTNPDNISIAVARVIRQASFILLLEYLLDIYKIKWLIDMLFHLFEIIHYSNLLSQILYPNGIYHVVRNGIYEVIVKSERGWNRSGGDRLIWLLGHQTTLIKYIIPAVAIGIMYSYFKYHKAICNRALLLFFVCLVELITANSATNYIILAILPIIYIFININNRFRLWFFVPIYTLFYTLTSLLSDNMKALLWLSETMGRSVRISTRVIVWQNAVKAILQHPFVGYGVINEESLKIRLALGNYGHPHSDFLWILYETGIIGVIFFLVLLIRVEIPYRKIKKNHMTCLVYSCVLSVMVAMFTDDYLFRTQYALIVFFLFYHSPAVCNEIMKENT